MLLGSTFFSGAAAGGGDGGWSPPDGATAFLDFTAGHYYAAGSIQDVADLLGGDGLDLAYIDSNGMLIPTSNGKVSPFGNRPEAAGQLMAAITEAYNVGGTIVLEVSSASFADTFGLHRFFWAKNGSYFGSPDEGFSISGVVSPSAFLRGADFYDAVMDSTNFALSGIQKMAITLGRETVPDTTWQWAFSVNGETAITSDVTYTIIGDPLNTAIIGQWLYDPNDDIDDYYIRKITVFPPLDPTALPVLTAL